jgi:plasmid stabilization system protein ParE
VDEESSDERVSAIFWHQQAAEDLYRIEHPLEATSPTTARNLYQAVQKTSGKGGWRERARPWCLVHRTSWPYTIHDASIVVLAVMHGAQRWPETFAGIDDTLPESSRL